jgi:hypothetical protein
MGRQPGYCYRYMRLIYIKWALIISSFPVGKIDPLRAWCLVYVIMSYILTNYNRVSFIYGFLNVYMYNNIKIFIR